MWIETWNQDPKPFVWTKTTEEIRHSLAQYLDKISPAANEKAEELRGCLICSYCANRYLARWG